MDTRLARLLGAAFLAVVALPACDDPTPRNCEVVSKRGSDIYNIKYELVLPADCPVPLGLVGEEKRAGARIFDEGARDFSYAEVQMSNSDLKFLVSRLFRFVSDDQGRYGAVPRTDYPAGTGSHGGNNLNQKFDYGFFAVTNSSTGTGTNDPYGELKITYKFSGMFASMSGATIPLSNTTETWTVNVSGGVSPYTYNWFRDGALVGTGSSYTGSVGTQDINLLAEVTDAAMVVRKAVIPVDVDGVLASINGPSVVWYSEGGGTWTASGQGGYLPYSFDWYIGDQWVGSGASWSGYPGEGNQHLGVRIRDTSGSSHSTYMDVYGSGNDTCAPVPPAILC